MFFEYIHDAEETFDELRLPLCVPPGATIRGKWELAMVTGKCRSQVVAFMVPKRLRECPPEDRQC